MIIYVGNLPPGATENELRQEFVIFGKVNSVALMNDRGIGSGRGRGCGYVEMPSVKEGEAAIEQLKGKSFKGNVLDIIKGLPVTHGPYSKPDSEIKISGFNRKTLHRGV
jgi:RNA recognition motif-containing protein